MRVETIAPGGLDEISHVLWDVLKQEQPKKKQIDSWLRRLNLNVSEMMFQLDPLSKELSDKREALDDKLLNKLVGHADIDTLAALTILLHEAVLREQYEQAFKISQHIYQVLLILGMQLQSRGIVEELIDVYCERVFSKITWNGYRFTADRSNFIYISYILDLFGRQQQSANEADCSLTWEAHLRRIREVVSDYWEADLICSILMPIYWPTDESSKYFRTESRAFFLRQFKKNSAWEYLSKKINGCLALENQGSS
jgi:hypothetical protein